MSHSLTVAGSRIRSLHLAPLLSRTDSGGPALPEAVRRHHAVLPPANPPKPRLLDQVREAIRTRHYSDRTEEAYVG